MLKNVHPLLGPELLYILGRMGHGDEIAVVDANFPAESHAARLVRMDGVTATALLEAIVSVLPIDSYVDVPVHTMQVVGDADAVPEIVREFQTIISRHSQVPIPHATLERDAFYVRSRNAFVIVATGETRLYGNILVSKGVVDPGQP